MSTERRRKCPSPIARRAHQWRERTDSIEGAETGLHSSRAAEREIQESLALRPCFLRSCGRHMKPSSKSYIPALGYGWLTRFTIPWSDLLLVRLHSKTRCSGKRPFKMGTES